MPIGWAPTAALWIGSTDTGGPSSKRVTAPTHYREDAKRAAIDQWTADPCGPLVEGEPGSRSYFEQLLARRHEYAPWMADVLGYDGARGLRVLDVGCGQGIDIARYAMAGATVTGIDLTPRHVELATAHLAAMKLDATIVRGDAERLPFADGSFDRVSSNGVLHHTPDMPAALREIRRVLVPPGEARIIVYNRSSAWFWLGLILQQGVLRGDLARERGSLEALASRTVEFSTIGARPLVRFYTPRSLREILAEAGFSDVRTEVRQFVPDNQLLTRWMRSDWRLTRWLDCQVGFYVIAFAS